MCSMLDVPPRSRRRLCSGPSGAAESPQMTLSARRSPRSHSGDDTRLTLGPVSAQIARSQGRVVRLASDGVADPELADGTRSAPQPCWRGRLRVRIPQPTLVSESSPHELTGRPLLSRGCRRRCSSPIGGGDRRSVPSATRATISCYVEGTSLRRPAGVPSPATRPRCCASPWRSATTVRARRVLGPATTAQGSATVIEKRRRRAGERRVTARGRKRRYWISLADRHRSRIGARGGSPSVDGPQRRHALDDARKYHPLTS